MAVGFTFAMFFVHGWPEKVGGAVSESRRVLSWISARCWAEMADKLPVSHGSGRPLSFCDRCTDFSRCSSPSLPIYIHVCDGFYVVRFFIENIYRGSGREILWGRENVFQRGSLLHIENRECFHRPARVIYRRHQNCSRSLTVTMRIWSEIFVSRPGLCSFQWLPLKRERRRCRFDGALKRREGKVFGAPGRSNLEVERHRSGLIQT